ncbi:non-ribosomal peptide synthetase [Vibrio penaeicida]|uniref:Carrier domain-containing protein n=1 Tax=Vibrio penaeicida TaxID=104609 RepID=A0AAV5NW01_9VIBR|nr:non-ribosomal peptide synthetase [Vibrio penaeicida]RTZ19598.1 amino acid adenylation domain-containing protein [Vibrio penaeicida]GLQ74489.1 hypothetical protein GCM10007932_38500 [Vibrio penaeicida]
MNTLDDDFDTDLMAELMALDEDNELVELPDIPEGTSFPLTDIQRAYFMGRSSQLTLGGAACQFYYERVCDELDVPRFIKAVQDTTHRHPMMRVEILSSESQVIRPLTEALSAPEHDLKSASEEVAQEHLSDTRQRLSRDLPELDKWPLFDLEFTHMPSGETHIHFRFDLINTDQQSILLVLKDIAALYEDPDTHIAAPELTFPQYLAMSAPSSEKLEASKNHWRSRAKDLPPAPVLPLINSVEEAGVPQYERISKYIPNERWSILKNIAQENGITISCLLLECFGQSLARWSESSHFTLNMTLFNREAIHNDVPRVVGDFTTTMLFDMDMTANNQTRESRITDIQKSLWRDLEFNAVSGVEVMSMMAQAQGHLDIPLMPVVVTSTLSQDASSLMTVMDDLPGRPVLSTAQTPQVILDNLLIEENGQLAIHWDISVNVMSLSVANALMQDYCTQIDAIIDNPEVLKKPFSFNDPSDAHLVPNLPEASQARRLSDLWLENLSSAASKPAVIQGNESITHHDLAEKVAGLIEGLKARDVDEGSKVALIFNKSINQIAATLACSTFGVTFIPIDGNQPNSRQIQILQDLEPTLILHSGVDPAVLSEHPSWDISQHEIASSDLLHHCSGAKLDSLAYILFTSGSTGMPKGVMIQHDAALNTVLDINQRFNITSTDRVLALSELHFDLSIQDIFGTLGCGGAIVLPEISGKHDPSHWAQLCHRHQVTIWNTVPGLFEIYLDYLETNQVPPQHELNNIMLSGDWIGLTSPQRAKNFWPKARFYSLGGATEASIWSIYFEVNEVDSEWQSIPYGNGLGGQQVFVLTQDLEIAQPGCIGGIYIAGKGLANGYFKDSEKTATAFFNHPRSGLPLYCTGDLGAYDKDGVIQFHGRADGQLKINGFRLEIGEVSQAINGLDGIQDCRVLPKGEGTRKSLAAFVKPESETLCLESLKETLAQRLPHYMVPSIWYQVESFPLTSNGKIDNKALLALTEKAPTHRSFKPDNDLSEQVCNMVAEVLKREQVLPDDNLVALGVTSLELIALASRIQKFSGTRPQLTTLARTVAIPDLIELVAELLPSSSGNTKGKSIWPGEEQVQDYLEETPVILDALERRLFKTRHRALDDKHAINLPDTGNVPDASRRSARAFSSTPVTQLALSQMLDALRVYWCNNNQYRPYASAGGMYPIQTYLLAYQIEGLEKGTYLYDPHSHKLLPRGNTPLPQIENLSAGNKEWIGDAHFVLAFALNLPDIVPLYEGSSLPFGLIEAGSMAQLVDNYAVNAGIGTCHVGDLSPSQINQLCGLEKEQIYVHGLVGGTLTDEMLTQRDANNATFNIELTEETL